MFTRSSHVLLVDDNATELQPLLEALRGFPYRLSVAGDGIQGYTQAVSLLPDLILMDVRMPKRDGITTTRLLKANPATEHIPILFLTAASSVEDRLDGLRAGAVDYLLKPVQIEEVIEKVRIHLSLKKRLLTPLPGAVVETLHSSKMGQRVDSAQVLQRAAASIIMERLADPPRVSELAGLLAVSERRIKAAFKSSVGVSVFEYIRRERMCKAARLLVQTDLSILDIVAEVGYSSAANFSTAFRQYWGMTPSTFRESKSHLA